MDQSFIDNSTGRIHAEPDTSSNSTRCFGNFLIAANQVAGFCESTTGTYTVRADGGEARKILKHKYDTNDLISAVEKDVKGYLDAASGKKEKEELDRMNGIEEEKGSAGLQKRALKLQSLSSNFRELELSNFLGLVLGCIEAKFCK